MEKKKEGTDWGGEWSAGELNKEHTDYGGNAALLAGGLRIRRQQNGK